ncbi:hypothetical protein SAMN05216337_11181, partial [Bradyrhizobium brasilense]
LTEDLAMRTYDFAPLWRSTIGFDRLFDLLDETQHRTEDNYPPTISSDLVKIGIRFPWRWLASTRMRSR